MEKNVINSENVHNDLQVDKPSFWKDLGPLLFILEQVIIAGIRVNP